jgi:predicted O-linked N-acetylglucosamine transferase (SPINDLY family)
MSTGETIPQPTLNTRELLDLYHGDQHEELSERFLAILRYFQAVTVVDMNAESQFFIDTFVKTFLFLFTQPDYVLADRHLEQFVSLNVTISNLAAISAFKNTDAFLEHLAIQPNNFVKVLTLYSARNEKRFDYKDLFDTHPQLASLWYSCFVQAYYPALANPAATEGLRAHLQYWDQRLSLANLQEIYFGVTYIDPAQEKAVKQRLNEVVRSMPLVREANIQNKPRKKQIAVASAFWFPGHSVHRILCETVAALTPDYELTLVHLGPPRDNEDVGPFQRTLSARVENNELYFQGLRQNQFEMVFFPDVGMSLESILLANMRLAPIQVCGLGHSVSTFGAEIDYYISGTDVECKDLAEENYSERLVLLPGLGCVHAHPTYELRHPAKTTSQFVVDCPWYAQKVNHDFLDLLREIVDQAGKDVLLRIFQGCLVQRCGNSFLPFVRDVERRLGKQHVEVVPDKSYEEYMTLMEEGDICIDSWHFGGCNTIADALYLRKPTVTYEGTRWYNRIGSATLRAVGMEELIATNHDEYRSLVLRLIDDDAYRMGLEERLCGVDLGATVFDRDGGAAFKRAVDFLIENHQRLKAEGSRSPLVISEPLVA